MNDLSGAIIGYDPGGNEEQGFATLHVEHGTPQALETEVIDYAESAIRRLEDTSDLIGFGIDTMTCWSTGKSGWRPADKWLRDQYKDVQHSVVAPNSMSGSMGINGMAVLLKARESHPDLFVTETHPKVLYHALFDGQNYDFDARSSKMNKELASVLGNATVDAEEEHEWDAAVSTLAVLKGKQGEWTNDLHEKDCGDCGPLVHPSSGEKTHYFWPEGP